MFHVGQRVCCIYAGSYGGQKEMVWDPGEELVEGHIYTIHSIFSHPDIAEELVRLVERKRSTRTLSYWGHDGYGACRFRPLVTKQTDISIFTAMLNPSKQGVDA